MLNLGSLAQCTLPPLSAGRGCVVAPTKLSERGGFTGSQFLEGGCWERGGDLFQGGGLQFLHKK